MLRNPRAKFSVMAMLFALALTGCGRKPQSGIFAIGLPTNIMNYHAAQQRGNYWCWAASIQMALSAKGIQIDQAEIVRRTFGNVVDRPGSGLDILRNLNGTMVTRDGRHVRVVAHFASGPPTFADLERLLEAGTPVVISYSNPGTSIGHAVVITAAVCEHTDRGPKIHRILVRDPDPSFAWSQGKRELSPEEFLNMNGYFLLLPET